MACTPSSSVGPRRAGPVLSVSNLTVSFGSKTIFTNISFDINLGERLFVQGPSGIGKSRLLRAVAELDATHVRPWPPAEHGAALSPC
jgi:ABC-type transporter Mla maintaining outer membrane lipid asymmetry ATPase subunit MlaF